MDVVSPPAFPPISIRSAARLKSRGCNRIARRGKLAILRQLRHWIAGLTLKTTGVSTWSEYSRGHRYDDQSEAQKRDFVATAVTLVQPGALLDLGCNVGDYAVLALENGAARVIGADADHLALERAFSRAQADGLNFLPIYLDAANPSPGQGWNGVEREGFPARARADMSLSLAFLHHLAIGRNIPLVQAVEWILALAPHGVIEFVNKDDPMITRMLSLRQDIFPDYNQTAFEAVLSARSEITARMEILGGHRVLYQFAPKS